MNYWYLVASLPYLRFGEKPALSRSAFLSSCAGQLPAAEFQVLSAVFENRCAPDSAAAAQWWSGEVGLRNAVVRVRAKNRGVDAARFLQPHDGFSMAVEEMVTDAFARANPLEQEADLDRIRWGMADELALTAPFGFPGVLAFAVKLRIAERWAGFDGEEGRKIVEELILASAESR
ncbi:MAG TPA: DUF2764 family protein [Pontiellaceae bacterium]|mgnify:CR=1 FL=1|nr:DUF2764 family protein [Pontiellaceae bacterium]